MQDFLKKKFELPEVICHSVNESGSYLCYLEQESVCLVNDRKNLEIEDSKQLIAKWEDSTPNLFMRFRTNDDRSISDLFQLLGYEHPDVYCTSSKTVKEKMKETWKKKFADEGIIVKEFVVLGYEDDVYICAKTNDNRYFRIANDENTKKLHMKLASVFHQLGFKTKTIVLEDVIRELKLAKGMKNITINLVEKINPTLNEEEVFLKFSYNEWHKGFDYAKRLKENEKIKPEEIVTVKCKRKQVKLFDVSYGYMKKQNVITTVDLI
jgi:hypothetical protein